MHRSLHTEVWRVCAIVLLNVLISNYFAYSCDTLELDQLQCGPGVAPTNRTSIVDLNSSGCNGTHIWISWDWTTPMGCAVEKVAITSTRTRPGYTCYMEDGSKFNELYKKTVRSASITEWSYAHTWNTSSTPRPVECNIAGFFEIERPCKQSLLPVNITCSKTVPPTSASSVLMPSSSSLIMTTLSQKVTYTFTLNTLIVSPTPTMTPEQNITFPSSTLSETQKIIITMLGFTVALLFITASVVMLLKRWKNKKPNYYTNYDNDIIDFKPDFTPAVIPDEVIIKDDIVSIRSTITPLEKIDKNTLVFTDISAAQKLSQPKDYREQG